jgi:hypothetical protein
MNTTYTSNDGKTVISVRQQNARQTAYALHVNGQYKGSKVLPANNTAVVQNFGFAAADFAAIAA